eukprot:scaffold7537_cov179-Ochromonas_danica.AAC.11
MRRCRSEKAKVEGTGKTDQQQSSQSAVSHPHTLTLTQRGCCSTKPKAKLTSEPTHKPHPACLRG